MMLKSSAMPSTSFIRHLLPYSTSSNWSAYQTSHNMATCLSSATQASPSSHHHQRPIQVENKDDRKREKRRRKKERKKERKKMKKKMKKADVHSWPSHAQPSHASTRMQKPPKSPLTRLPFTTTHVISRYKSGPFCLFVRTNGKTSNMISTKSLTLCGIPQA
ncbi:hypothetical protein M440DRAFT_341828 [Trichoderma longibrachiatum ATCC 18648]|uniref:Uncharacterized protein n=1 Tax=Trichoderma longibrachiatum ATCC 18648 TaxID=983965 RepID=A0A2T4C1I6_TRILO|nr:hypothetical protein M440DRAFT_341828 [Trichoderma longibrachiatum ATCC 18648]